MRIKKVSSDFCYLGQIFTGKAEIGPGDKNCLLAE
jgi:hypothetical protein